MSGFNYRNIILEDNGYKFDMNWKQKYYSTSSYFSELYEFLFFINEQSEIE